MQFRAGMQCNLEFDLKSARIKSLNAFAVLRQSVL